MAQAVVILSTCPDQPSARRLAELLVTGRLAACVNIVPGIESIFWWDNKLDKSHELLLIVKTTRVQLAAVVRTIRREHPYDVPEVIALPVTGGSPPYLRWLAESVRPPRASTTRRRPTPSA
jgi:periplasmic divalent cation tolerance protein